MSEEKLKMSFEPTVIEHLGVKMYSHTVPAIAELIANAYDACATEVEVRLFDKPEHKIVIKDNGIGMSFDEINDFYLRIGRNRREEKQASPCGRIPTGKKVLVNWHYSGLATKSKSLLSKETNGLLLLWIMQRLKKVSVFINRSFRKSLLNPIPKTEQL